MNSNIPYDQTNRKVVKKLSNIFHLLLTAALVSAIPATTFANNHQPAPDLFDEVGIQQSTNKLLPVKAVNGKNHSVNVHTELLNSDTLTLNLFGDVIVTAVRDRMIANVNGSSTWIGHVEGEQDSEVFLSIRNKTMSGTVQIGTKTYEIAPNGKNQHEIAQIDPAKNPQLNGDAKQPLAFVASGGQITSTTTAITTPPVTGAAASTGTVIDLLVVYTPKALSNAGSVTGIEAKITNAVAMANQAYLNSNIAMQLNIVGMSQTQYVETGDINTALSYLANTNDGIMDDVPALRDKLGADQVTLVDTDANLCGIGYIMSGSWVSTAFAPYAYSVTHDDSVYACLSTNTLAHELGHNQGNVHDLQDASSQGAYAYSYGYRLCQAGGFIDIMSYACAGVPRVSYFSNPQITMTNLEVTGTATANTAQSMSNTKDIVAAFRSPPIALPTAPSSLIAVNNSGSQIALTWADNSSNETGFLLERSVGGINWSQFASVGSNVISYTDTGLVGSTAYSYRARAYNSGGSSNYSNISTATTAAAVSDTTPPVINVLNPKVGATVSGIVSINVAASDNVSVSSLKLYIDNKLVGTANASSLSYSWNTRKFGAGAHTIKAQAVDPSGNISNQSVSVIK